MVAESAPAPPPEQVPAEPTSNEASSKSAPVELPPRGSTIFWRFAVVLALIVLDLWSKARVFAFLEDNVELLTRDVHGHRRYLVIGEWLTFMQSLNPGAAFGQLDSVPYLLVIGRSVAVLFLIWLIARAPRTRPVYAAALVLVLSGAAGNLWDNLFEQPLEGYPFGAVRDFIDVYFPFIGEDGWHFPTFNVADSCITVGAVLLLLSGFGESDEKEASPSPGDAAAPAS